MFVLDTSVIYALSDRREIRHLETVAWYREHEPDLATTPLVLAETDYRIGELLGRRAQARWWADLAAGPYAIDWWPSAGKQIAELARRWAETDLGLTDASLIALADRYETLDIATFDHRHFRAVRSLDGGQPFRLHPADV